MATKAQKQFRKEMKKIQREQRKKRNTQKQPLSYIYKTDEGYNYSRTYREKFQKWSYILFRVALVVGLLSFTGAFDRLIMVTQELIPISPLNKQKLVFEYMDEYEKYIYKAQAIINQYNTSTLSPIEMITLQQSLIDDISFLSEYDQSILTALNIKLKSYHETLLEILTLGYPSTTEQQLKVLDYSINLTTIQLQFKNELVKLFESVNMKYEVKSDGSIFYESQYPLRELQWRQ